MTMSTRSKSRKNLGSGLTSDGLPAECALPRVPGREVRVSPWISGLSGWDRNSVWQAPIRQNSTARRFVFLEKVLPLNASTLNGLRHLSMNNNNEEHSMSHPFTTVSNMKYKPKVLKVHQREQHKCKRCSFEYGGNPSHDMPCDRNCCMSVGYLEIPLGADILTAKGERLCLRHIEGKDQIVSVGIEVCKARRIFKTLLDKHYWNQV